MFERHKEKAWEKWKPKEHKFLSDNYLIMSDDEMARGLKRSFASVVQRRSILKLRRPTYNAHYFTKTALQRLRIAVKFSRVLNRMKKLIELCQIETNTYKLNKYKQELKKLSGIK